MNTYGFVKKLVVSVLKNAVFMTMNTVKDVRRPVEGVSKPVTIITARKPFAEIKVSHR
jgi:hypothetical protein